MAEQSNINDIWMESSHFRKKKLPLNISMFTLQIYFYLTH